MRNKYSKNYYFSSHFTEIWSNARSVCKHYGFDLMSLDTVAEMNNFTTIYSTKKSMFTNWVITGGVESIRNNVSSYVWITTGKPFSFPITWTTGNPDNSGGVEWCLSFDWRPNTVKYNDFNCGGTFPMQFICEQKFFKGFGKK